jgi:selenocysteine-specific elongation factor
LIRTIIGGAQIIDMILLVVDANKGIQTQTAECIVIGEITTDNMIVVLNKVDMIPEEERAAKLERVSNRIRKVFASTKFAGVPIVYTAAAVGGEKSTGAAASTGGVKKSPSFGVDDLVELIKSKVQIPVRNYSAPFYYAIDHCFSIKGHGTVLTGTVLSGSVSANSTIELPHLQLQRKVKSLQMFRKPVKGARQGDRVGICVTNLDASLIERGIAAAPGSVPLLQSVLCLVKKVRFFRSACKSMTKFHISIGHSTVIATAVFYGPKQLNQSSAQKKADDGSTGGTVVAKHADSGAAHKQSALNATYQRGFPDVSYQYYDPDSASTGASTGEQAHLGYEYQDEMVRCSTPLTTVCACY